LFSRLFEPAGRHLLSFYVAKRLDAIMSSFDVAFAFDARQGNLLRRHALGFFHVTLLRFVNNDSLKLFLLIEEVGYVKKRIALKPDVNEGRLHSGQHAHDASFVNVADNSLIACAAFKLFSVARDVTQNSGSHKGHFKLKSEARRMRISKTLARLAVN